MANSFDGFRHTAQQAFFGALDDHIDRLGWDRPRIIDFQRQRCRALLAHAAAHSPFHARRLAVAGIDPAQFELADLQRLPVMTKADLMTEFDDIVTDPRARLAAAEHALSETATEPSPIDDVLIVLASGGSSGERGVFVLDAATMAEFGCLLLRPMMARLRTAGGPAPGGLTIGIVAAGSAVHATGAGPRMLDGSPLRFVSVPVTLPIEQIVDRLNSIQPEILFGYPSMLAVLALEQSARRLRIRPAAITVTSETLQTAHRDAIGAGFGGAPIVNSFGSTEGLVGATPPNDQVFTFASDACITELVDANDRPVPPGTSSDAVLVTNLYNRIQPLIRYRLDDQFVDRGSVPGHGHLRAEVTGRGADVLVYDGVRIHPVVIRSALTQISQVIDYQIRQVPAGVHIDVVTNGLLDQDRIAIDIRDRLARAGLADPEVTVTPVGALPRHPLTGKKAHFVPLAVSSEPALR
ncbi:MAG TPA: hypothetical protein VKG85_00480 [Actinomycetes bacterium]|nr:hypothetical protein [Actinomycetes bacterium]